MKSMNRPKSRTAGNFIARPHPGATKDVADTAKVPVKSTGAPVVSFPRCDAAVRKVNGSEWELADAIVAECSETGDDGVRNDTYALMEAMRDEIAQNHGVALSFERIRKLRQVASAFTAGRRRPAVSIEGHLEAGTPDALDALINGIPKGTALTREYIRQSEESDRAGRAEQAQRRAPSSGRGPATSAARNLQAVGM